MELLQIIAMTISGLLFSLGGLKFKYLRRFIFPILLGIVALLAGFIWWKCLILCLGLIGAFCLPYGERTPYWGKFLVGCAFVFPTVILGFSWWQIITPICFIVMFKLSNTKFTSNIFFWKAVEFITGSLIGITVASLL